MKRCLFCLIAFLALLSCSSVRRGSAQIYSQTVSATDVKPVSPSAPAGQQASPSAGKEGVTPSVSAKTPAAEKKETLSDQVIAYARTFLGTPYKLGASGPKLFDCSGFTCYVFKHFGYRLTQYSGAQFNEGREVASYADLQKGDLVFFGKRGSVRNIGHVGIVVSVDESRGSFRFIHASSSSGVTESESTQAYYMMRYIGARRILPDEAPGH